MCQPVGGAGGYVGGVEPPVSGAQPPVLLLQASRATRLLWTGLGAVGLCVVVWSGVAADWGRLLGAGVVAVFAIWQSARPGCVAVVDGELILKHAGKTETFNLAECGEFKVRPRVFEFSRGVIFDYRVDEAGWLRRANRRIVGASVELPGTYGLRARELAARLNEARARFVTDASA